jgi:hypothetical protein
VVTDSAADPGLLPSPSRALLFGTVSGLRDPDPVGEFNAADPLPQPGRLAVFGNEGDCMPLGVVVPGLPELPAAEPGAPPPATPPGAPPPPAPPPAWANTCTIGPERNVIVINVTAVLCFMGPLRLLVPADLLVHPNTNAKTFPSFMHKKVFGMVDSRNSDSGSQETQLRKLRSQRKTPRTVKESRVRGAGPILLAHQTLQEVEVPLIAIRRQVQ